MMASAPPARPTRSAVQILTALGALTLIAIIIWIDISTTLWQEMVILAGLAAGLVSFLLTTVFVNRFHQRQLEARWAPVTHMALTSVLHHLADERHSDLSRGVIRPRTLSVPTTEDSASLQRELEKLRQQVLKEQNHLTSILGTWSEFLTSTGDNTDILRSTAELALQLEQVRDAALDAEHQLDVAASTSQARAALAELSNKVASCNDLHAQVIDALQTRLEAHVAR
ncbi:hypothetical protein [Corynebacterium efficiens YS-314]|uniref:Uncharacterized protein n=2 Tax=Corynebacterium efficiens TaxID=152794 RepID=Q8FTT2_COREF|nr:hypothetical protein [Corynebacterium efficiens YS-314]